MKRTLENDAVAGDPYACLALAYFMQTGKELDMDIPEAVNWYERAADLGCARAHWELSKIYAEGQFVRPDQVASFNHLVRSAELGNADAQLALADEYLAGDRVRKDSTLAFGWYMKSAEQGVSLAKFIVGYMYAHGQGVPRSDTEAEMWFSSAALTGPAELFMNIGMSYEYGINGICHNEVEAARWYKYGVDMGHEQCIICWNSVMRSLGGEPRSPSTTGYRGSPAPRPRGRSTRGRSPWPGPTTSWTVARRRAPTGSTDAPPSWGVLRLCSTRR